MSDAISKSRDVIADATNVPTNNTAMPITCNKTPLSPLQNKYVKEKCIYFCWVNTCFDVTRVFNTC